MYVLPPPDPRATWPAARGAEAWRSAHHLPTTVEGQELTPCPHLLFS